MHTYDVDLFEFVARPTKGSLLVAAPQLTDPNFHRSVIFMVQHSPQGALGLIVNRPTEEEGFDRLEPWLRELSEPAVIFAGGPVQTDALIAIGSVDPDLSSELISPIIGGLSSLDVSQPPDELLEGLRSLRIFRGYAGWGPGQLEDELEEGSWLVLTVQADDVFTTHPQGLWRNVLRRTGGRKALLADAPDDLSWN